MIQMSRDGAVAGCGDVITSTPMQQRLRCLKMVPCFPAALLNENAAEPSTFSEKQPPRCFDYGLSGDNSV